MFRFVSDSTNGIGTKRKYSHKSCESCKKRHKRCSHTSGDSTSQGGKADEASVPRTSYEREPPASESVASQQRDRPSPTQHPTSEGVYLRFVGDLSPEASFLASNKRDTGQQKRRAEVGVWLGQKPEGLAPSDERDPENTISTDSQLFQLTGLAGLRAINPYLRQECISIIPPKYELDLLSSLYYAKFNPIFPILDGEDIEKQEPTDKIALQQAMCLVAALDPSLRTHLRLSQTGIVLSPIEFRSCIAMALKHTLDGGLIRDKMVQLQVTALMAMYVDKPGSSDISSHYVAQAVELSQTLGLHLGWPSEEGSTAKPSRIFWCVWTLDRLNAATNGRPILIHDRDMDRRILDTVREQMPAFRLLISISKFLDQTIPFYRPASGKEDVSVANEAPTFEDLIHETGTADVSSALLASLELFYLAVLILHSRPKKRNAEDDRVPSSNLQTFSAAGIISIASEEFKSSLTFWGIVPYAVSLASSVAYQTLRNSSLPYKRKQAYTAFYSSCDILDELSKCFLSARTNARLAKDTLREVERLSASRGKAKTADQNRDGAQSVQLDATANKAPDAPAILASYVVGAPSVTFDHAPHHQGTSTVDQVTAQPDCEVLSISNGHDIFENMDFSDLSGLFDDVNLDLDFHFNRMDAIAAANLNPTMPFFPQQWMDDDL